MLSATIAPLELAGKDVVRDDTSAAAVFAVNAAGCPDCATLYQDMASISGSGRLPL